ncbi:MAG: hypothetical protein AAF850_06550 [Pseudomonadota bacterium]
MSKVRGSTRLVATAFAGVVASALAIQSAVAGDEKNCASQYSQSEHAILEWAALGGDPHAQFAIAQCALPEGKRKYSDAERNYAVKWVSIAACDANDDDATLSRNVLTRRLKETGDLSFRRFGGDNGDEKFSKRAMMLQNYRERKRRELSGRARRLSRLFDDDERAVAINAMVSDLARIGAPGLMRLEGLAECPFIEMDAATKTAISVAASDVWQNSAYAEVYSDTDQNDENAQALTTQALPYATAEKKRALLLAAGIGVGELEREAALSKLNDFRSVALIEQKDKTELSDDGTVRDIVSPESVLFGNAETGNANGPTQVAFTTTRADLTSASASVSTLTTAIQYALEALGFVDFVNGPDNDYGSTTIDAAKKFQRSIGAEPTRLLTPQQSRRAICDAATDRDDPVSWLNVALMYQKGWGFPKNINASKEAIDRADMAMKQRMLNPANLEAWKQRRYPVISNQIKVASREITEVSQGLNKQSVALCK